MNPSISRKMDMVKNVFLNKKRLEESLTFAEFIDNNPRYFDQFDEFYEEDYPELQLLIEGNSNRKVSTINIKQVTLLTIKVHPMLR